MLKSFIQCFKIKLLFNIKSKILFDIIIHILNLETSLVYNNDSVLNKIYYLLPFLLFCLNL